MNKTITGLFILVLLVGCSTKAFHGVGEYRDENGKDRRIVLEWKTQEYFLPFNLDADYGSVILHSECLDNTLQDPALHPQYGLVFKERAQDFRVVDGIEKLRIKNFIVCASLTDGKNLNNLNAGDHVNLSVVCEAKPQMPPILPVNIVGYTLEVSVANEPIVLDCP